jgi:hypothetical protein
MMMMMMMLMMVAAGAAVAVVVVNQWMDSSIIAEMRVCIYTRARARAQGYIQKFPNWPSGARTANGTAPCH